MTKLSINQAKEIAYRNRKQGVLVIAFGDGHIDAVSYGMNRSKCRAAGKVLDDIVSRLGDGRIYVPDELADTAPVAAAPSGADMFGAEGGR